MFCVLEDFRMWLKNMLVKDGKIELPELEMFKDIIDERTYGEMKVGSRKTSSIHSTLCLLFAAHLPM